MAINQIVNNQQRLFWVLQLAGWAGWASTFYLGVLFWGGAKNLPMYELYLAGISTIGICLSLGLRWLYRKTWESSLWKRGLAIAGGSYVAGLAWVLSRSLIFSTVYANPEKASRMADSWQFWKYFENATSASWVMLVWSGLYFGVKYYLISQEEKQRYLKALSMAHEAQLKMLRYQLNPHFLFNTLNAISTLILDKDTALANSMVTKLSRFLRYSLVNDPMALVTVKEEVESLKLYLDIEKVRFAERLTLNFDIEQDAEKARMPSLLLQPLVENSIKYAISQSINGGYISVTARVDNGQLLLAVIDDGPGLDLSVPSGDGSGVGINNTRERLVQRYGTDHGFQLSTTDPHGLTVSIAIPLSYSDPASE